MYAVNLSWLPTYLFLNRVEHRLSEQIADRGYSDELYFGKPDQF